MAPPSLKKSIQAYKTVAQRLETKLEQLRVKQDEVEGRAFVVLDENTDQQNLEESPESYPTDVSSLLSTATNILIETTQLKLTFVQESLTKLRRIHQETPKHATPPELLFSRYEEWLATNQRLFELNSQLYDLEKLKFELRQKHSVARRSVKEGAAATGAATGAVESTGSQFVQSSVERIQSFLTRFHFPAHSTSTTESYLLELLNPRDEASTVESQKVQEFISHCLQHQDDLSLDPNVGAHPQNYHQFMAVLCSYIVQKQREFQGEELPKALVYSTVERYVMPKIQSAVQRYISQRERDEILHRQCEKYSSITAYQLRIQPALQSSELVPFIDSITQLRASYFSPTPTDKMYAVVAAAKALYEQLGRMGDTSINGDSFLDLWIYVIIKANVRDLATNLCFMTEYGNPQLGIDEAGYYLTTLEAAVTYIETLTPENLREPSGVMEFVVCECERFDAMQRLEGVGFEVVQHRVPLPCFKVAIIQEWALNRTRLFKTALLPTGCEDDIAIVCKIRLLPHPGNTAHIRYLTERLTQPEEDMEGLCCRDTALGLAVMVDMSNISRQEVIALPSGCYDDHRQKIDYVLHLIRLGSQGREESCDSCALPSSSFRSTSSSFVDIPSPRGSVAMESPRSRELQESTRASSFRSSSAVSFRRVSPSHSQSSPVKDGYRELSSPYLLNIEPASEICMQDMPPSSQPGSLPGKGRAGRFFKLLSQRSPVRMRKQAKEKRSKKAARYLSTPVITTGYKSNVFNAYNGTSVESLETSYQQPTPLIQVEVEVHDGQSSERTEQVSSNNNSLLSPSSSGRQRVASLQVQQCADAKSCDDTPRGRVLSLQPPSSSSGNTDPGLVLGGNFVPDQTQSLRSFPTSTTGYSLQATPRGQTSIEPSAEFAQSRRASEMSRFSRGAVDGVDFDSAVCAVKPHLANPQNILSERYTDDLERNFRENHLYGDTLQALSEAVRNTVLQGQVYLQRLNYISVTYKVDGVYCDTTLNAVRNFQRAHNKFEAQYSSELLENGYLTATTFQYLRQAFLTLFASMMRMGLDQQLGPGFNPMSTSRGDVQLFREGVASFQREAGLGGVCQRGALCSNTIDTIRQALRTKRDT